MFLQRLSSLARTAVCARDISRNSAANRAIAPLVPAGSRRRYLSGRAPDRVGFIGLGNMGEIVGRPGIFCQKLYLWW